MEFKGQHKPECKSLVEPISALAVSSASWSPIPLGLAAPRRNPAATDAHRIHLGNPWLCRRAAWSNKRPRVFHFVPDVMSNYRPIFVFPSMWMLIVRTSLFFCILRGKKMKTWIFTSQTFSGVNLFFWYISCLLCLVFWCELHCLQIKKIGHCTCLRIASMVRCCAKKYANFDWPKGNFAVFFLFFYLFKGTIECLRR